MNREILRNRWLTWLLVSALAFTLALPAAAQTPDSKEESVSKVERKNRAPVSKDILRVQLPKPVEAKLDNGLTVLIMEDHRFPTVSVSLTVVGAGPIYEPADWPGLAGITAQMLREGTKTRSSKDIAEQVDTLGATLFANSGFGSESANLNASGLSDNLNEWFALFADVLINPSFPESELNKLKPRLLTQLKQQRAQPGFLAEERFNRAVYGSHPASVVTATTASIQGLTSAALAKWHAERYTPQNAILGISGNVKASEIVPKLNQWLAGWKKTDLAVKLPDDPTPAKARKVFLVDRPDSVQTSVGIGNIALDRRHADYIALTVMNRIVGGGAAARLFINLREEKGYTYGAYSNLTALKYPGPWRAFGEVRTEVTEGAMTEFFNEINRIQNEAVPAWELDDAKRSVVANFALSLEQPTTLLNLATTRKLYGFPDDYWDKYPAEIMAVTAADVQRVAKKYLQTDTLQVVAVGDGKKIQAIMEKWGPLEVYDTEGKMSAAKGAVVATPND